MSCRPIHLSLEVDPSTTEKIVFTLDCSCDSDDQATWNMTFELQEGNPLATVVNFSLEIDPGSPSFITRSNRFLHQDAKITFCAAREPISGLYNTSFL